MIHTNNKIFIDSSVLVEALKGNKLDFYKSLISNSNNDFCINDTVLSEYLYYVLAFSSGTSPKSVQGKNQIQNILSAEIHQVEILKNFTLLRSDNSFLSEVPRLMSLYNLLPNDAIILATCKLNGIVKLASHDADFIVPCQQEKIELLNDK